MYDEDNTEWQIDLLIKTGGGDPVFGTGEGMGIHWHMNIGVKIEYIARDEQRQDIPWIRMTNRATGEVTVYQDEDDPLTDEEMAAEVPRVMDCIDCHNRPSHRYNSPEWAVDTALRTGRIDPSLPYIKSVAVDAMDNKFETEDEALASIASEIRAYYEEEYPDVAEERESDITQAIEAVQSQYAQNMFPEMKVRWKEYPDNSGHLIFPGCMRCHSGNKVDTEGTAITRDCKACHAIIVQGPADDLELTQLREGMEFRHPDGDDDWRDTGCHECHEGVQP
jgi:hypothetical protein